jgi:hypothetical protein
MLRTAYVRRRLIGALNRLPSRALRHPSDEIPVVGWLPEFAWTHEQGHLREIKGWWRTARPAARGGNLLRLRRRRPRGRALGGPSDPWRRGHRDPGASP